MEENERNITNIQGHSRYSNKIQGSNNFRITSAKPPAYSQKFFKKGQTTEEQLEDQYKITNWGNNFLFIEFNTRQLNSVFVNQIPHFTDCRQMIDEFNKEIQECKQKNIEIKNGPWKYKFYHALFYCLSEIIFTEDRLWQKKFAETVNKWAFEQLSNFSISGGNSQMVILNIEEIKSKYATVQKSETGDNISAANKKGSKLMQPPTIKKRGTRAQSVGNPGTRKGRGQENQIIQLKVPMEYEQLLRYPSLYNPNQIIEQQENNQNISNRPVTGQQSLHSQGVTTQASTQFRPNSGFQSIPKQVTFSNIQRPVSAYQEFDDGRPQTGGTYFQEEDLIYQENIQEKNKDYQQIPSEVMEQTKKDYSQGHRSQNPEYAPPYMKLREYKVKTLEFEDPSKLTQKFMKGMEQESKVAYVKPMNYLPRKEEPEIFDEPQDELDEDQEQQLIVGQPPQEDIKKQVNIEQGDADIIYVEKEIEEVGLGYDAERPMRGKTVPDIQAYVEDKPKLLETDLKKKFEQRSKYTHYEPSNDIEEIQMEQKWMQNRHKEMQQKREDEEQKNYIKEWGLAKGRIQQEINRKIESNAYGSNFDKCEYKPKVYKNKEMRQMEIKMGLIQVPKRTQQQQHKQSFYETEINGQAVAESEDEDVDYEYYYEDQQNELIQIDAPWSKKARSTSFNVHPKTQFVDLSQRQKPPIAAKDQNRSRARSFLGLEKQIDKQKLTSTQQKYGKLISLPPTGNTIELSETQAKIEALPSLTITSQPRPFSAVFEQMDQEKYRDQQIDEIEEIKRRMAKYKINIPINQLQQALLVPEDVHDEEKLQDLPVPGMRLLINPHFKVKKKKKKKKKTKK